MENKYSEDFGEFFLIKFTEELIRQYSQREITKLQKIVETKEQKQLQKLAEEKPQIPSMKPVVNPAISKPQVSVKSPVVQNIIQNVSLPRQFPQEPQLPSHLGYIQPAPTPNVEIDLNKLNPLVKDNAVKIIEANPNENVKVTGNMGTKTTGILLTKEDISQIIGKFSEASKIPTTDGVYKVAVGSLILSAIISEVTGSRFIITKMAAPQPQNFPQRIVPQNQPIQNRNLQVKRI